MVWKVKVSFNGNYSFSMMIYLLSVSGLDFFQHLFFHHFNPERHLRRSYLYAEYILKSQLLIISYCFSKSEANFM